MADALGIDNDMMFLAALPVADNIIDQLLLIVIVLLGDQDVLRAVRDTAPECDIARISSHDLDDAAALMGRRCVAHFINRLHGGVERRVKPDRILAAGNVQVDGPRDPDRIDALLRQFGSSGKGAVPADDHETLDAMLPADLRCLLLSLQSPEFMAARCVQNGAALTDRIGHSSGVHIHNFLIQQTAVSLINALYLHSERDPPPNNRPDCGIHARRISAAGQNTDGFAFRCHKNLLILVLSVDKGLLPHRIKTFRIFLFILYYIHPKCKFCLTLMQCVRNLRTQCA